MASHGDFRHSSPAGAPGRQRSQFTYRNFAHLASYTTSCPLRVVAHIDLDAFYAQCEMRRLNLPDEQPLAVQQWQGLIAVNYAARDKGIGRFHEIHEARKLCDNLICQHVATWREGEDSWAYRDEPLVNTDKVSLDPYRLQSRKILSIIKESLPANLQKVEKASIDEVFLDLSAHVHSVMLERFSELSKPPPYDDPTEKLPMPSISALDWKADALIDVDETETEIDDPDWDDVAILIGSEIVRDVRIAIRNTLEFTCSAGIAQNKMLAKLGSGSKKPNGQTVIRNRAIGRFLSGFKITKIRNLGGKLGDQVVQLFGTDSTNELLLVPLEQFKLKLGDDTGVWLYNTIRGIDHSDVNSRVHIKSMLSAKSFRPSINSIDQAYKWLRIFVGDIYSRLVEEGVLENKRRPRTINLHHRHGGQTKSRQNPIPQGRPIDQTTLFDLAKNLMNQIVLEGQVWPCANLSLSVGGFDEGVTGNMGISAFLLHGEEAQALKRSSREVTAEPPLVHPPGKQSKLEKRLGIQQFFSARTERSQDDDAIIEEDRPSPCDGHAQPSGAAAYICERCRAWFDFPEDLQCHEDEHLARDLQQEEERGNRAIVGRSGGAHASSSVPLNANVTARSATTAAASRRPANKAKQKTESGQSKLKFS
ncbi:sister chromatid cohesion protein Eso1 [Coniella lustricola]|uniref:DNA polymerase eta n=1 Tax=Coniella lustricola TaxID=2025994 RepID=A0A2T3ALR4_9PEZI|nr:sister chromatid cohesion protein Eso1 [Coniella lustricola]